MTLDPEILERAAVALFHREYGPRFIFENTSDETRQRFREDATAALTAALGDHSVIVPRAITPVITKAYIAADPRRRRFAASAKRDWNAMISAAHDKGADHG